MPLNHNLCLFKNYSKIWLILTIFLFTCAPLPKEGESLDRAEVTLTLQHRSSERSERVGSSSRSTEFIVVVAGEVVEQTILVGSSGSSPSGVGQA